MINYAKNDKLLIKLICFTIIFIAFFTCIRGFDVNSVILADYFAIIGLVYLIIGLLMWVNNLGLFDSTKYGFLKFWEIMSIDECTKKNDRLKTYNNYLKNVKHNKKYISYLLAALINIASSFLLI